MCEFCIEFEKINCGNSKTRVILERDGFAVMPTLGCFTDGYLLIVPRQHSSSLAQMPETAWAAATRLAEDIRAALQPTFGTFVLAEHGALDRADTGAACCDHCHLHLIPMRERSAAVLQRYRKVGGWPPATGGAERFANYHDTSYVMVSIVPGEYQFWPAARFERQFVRKVCADLLGRPDHYNWREHHFTEIMWRTKFACEKLLVPRLENALV